MKSAHDRRTACRVVQLPIESKTQASIVACVFLLFVTEFRCDRHTAKNLILELACSVHASGSLANELDHRMESVAAALG